MPNYILPTKPRFARYCNCRGRNLCLRKIPILFCTSTSRPPQIKSPFGSSGNIRSNFVLPSSTKSKIGVTTLAFTHGSFYFRGRLAFGVSAVVLKPRHCCPTPRPGILNVSSSAKYSGLPRETITKTMRHQSTFTRGSSAIAVALYWFLGCSAGTFRRPHSPGPPFFLLQFRQEKTVFPRNKH